MSPARPPKTLSDIARALSQRHCTESSFQAISTASKVTPQRIRALNQLIDALEAQLAAPSEAKAAAMDAATRHCEREFAGPMNLTDLDDLKQVAESRTDRRRQQPKSWMEADALGWHIGSDMRD